MKPCMLMCLMLLGLSLGCARPAARLEPPVPLDVLAGNLRWARDNIAALEHVPLSNAALERLQRAKTNLELAERAFAQESYDDAHFATLDSLAISQELVRQFYDESIVSSAKETKHRIEAIVADDPASPLQEFLPLLTDILDYSEGLEAARQDIDPARLLADFESVTNMSRQARNTIRRTLESDISFESGEYRLSAQGKEAVASYCRDILQTWEGVIDLVPGQPVRVQINIAGYTDEVDFKHGTDLVEHLTAAIDPQTIPRAEAARRQFLNRRLADFRVASLSQFLRQCLQDAHPDIRLEVHGMGLGEELPPGVRPSDALSDPQRRICKIATYILFRSAGE